MSILFIFYETISNGFNISFLALITVISIYCAVLIIIIKNPVISVLFLIGLFLCLAFYLISIGLTFMGLAYLLVYVGAVSILFIFILMLINIRISELISDSKNSILLVVLTVLLLSIVLNDIIPMEGIFEYIKNISNTTFFASSNSWDNNINSLNNISSLGNILYSTYFIFIIIGSMILLLAMVGAIIITIKQSDFFTEGSLNNKQYNLTALNSSIKLVPVGIKIKLTISHKSSSDSRENLNNTKENEDIKSENSNGLDSESNTPQSSELEVPELDWEPDTPQSSEPEVPEVNSELNTPKLSEVELPQVDLGLNTPELPVPDLFLSDFINNISSVVDSLCNTISSCPDFSIPTSVILVCAGKGLFGQILKNWLCSKPKITLSSFKADFLGLSSKNFSWNEVIHVHSLNLRRGPDFNPITGFDFYYPFNWQELQELIRTGSSVFPTSNPWPNIPNEQAIRNFYNSQAVRDFIHLGNQVGQREWGFGTNDAFFDRATVANVEETFTMIENLQDTLRSNNSPEYITLDNTTNHRLERFISYFPSNDHPIRQLFENCRIETNNSDTPYRISSENLRRILSLSDTPDNTSRILVRFLKAKIELYHSANVPLNIPFLNQ